MLSIREGGLIFIVLCLVVAAAAPPPASGKSGATNKDARNSTKTGERRAVVSKTDSRLPKPEDCGECGAKVAAKAAKGSKGRKARTKVPCHPPGYVDPTVARDFNGALRDLKRAGVKTKVTSAWRSSDDQAEMHRCSLSARCRGAHPGLYHAARPGESAHEGGFAVDISGVAAGPPGSRRLTPQGKKIVDLMNKHGYKWKYGMADPVHFEADPRTHGYRSLKQAIVKNQTRCQAKFNAALKADTRRRSNRRSTKNVRQENVQRSRTSGRS